MNAPIDKNLNNALVAHQFDAPAPYMQGQSLILHGDYFDRIERAAIMLSKARTIPEFLRNNVADCYSVVSLATRSNLDFFGLARKCWQGPNGQLELEGQAVISLINNSGLTSTRLDWEYFGDWKQVLGKFEWRETKKKDKDGKLVTDPNGNVKRYMAKTWADKDEEGLGVRCFATLRGEKNPRVLELLLKQAVTRNSSLWVEDPRQQLSYLSGRRWGRLHTPEAIMGIYSRDEMEAAPAVDMGEVDEVRVPDDLVKAAEAAANKGVTAYQAFWKDCTQLQRGLLNEASDHHERLKTLAAQVDSKRTVDVRPKPTPAPTPAPSPTPAPTAAPTAASDADPATGETTPPAGDNNSAFVPTYANVLDMMIKAAQAKEAEALDIAADWIGEIADEHLKKELAQKYEALKAEIAGGASQ